MGGNADDQRYGRWPRRLLHVPTMTSLEWQPGNRYGASICPPYNTLSYTWGRFVLREEQMPHVQALPVRFQGHRTWSIPRINPQHFTVDEFQAAVQLAVQVNETTEKNVEHLWLDIACIDQEHARTKHAEINRQAIIFQHAHTSSVWLTHIDECTLTEAIHRLRGVHNPWSSITLPDGRVYAIPHQSKDMEIETAKHWLRIWLQPVQDAIQKALLDTAATGEQMEAQRFGNSTFLGTVIFFLAPGGTASDESTSSSQSPRLMQTICGAWLRLLPRQAVLPI
ncbi:hypothetical protein BU26DRAFT_601610 [Trematosphaeria pertusa]|uniref:Heterokaryon incompatibility domain-containing protein n=1 Tax=Trematosphaeria pertusa TaxID=390896 RepID=A0A6A6IWB3_9PLEO|nr:uncharacterized protein BU26DRAFT_601610 [Trematosphaeria pertusa]KAF2253493.1 hypothetical protein BU26DRAFT_601610 [Trematosphaeria pertusa]